MNVRIGPLRRLRAEKLMLSNCGPEEDSRVPGAARRSNQTILKEINPEYSSEGNDKEALGIPCCEEPTPWKRRWWWERLTAKGEEGGRGWDGWKASLSPWIWVWANPGRERSTEEPGGLQSTGPQRVRPHWATEEQVQFAPRQVQFATGGAEIFPGSV